MPSHWFLHRPNPGLLFGPDGSVLKPIDLAQRAPGVVMHRVDGKHNWRTWNTLWGQWLARRCAAHRDQGRSDGSAGMGGGVLGSGRTLGRRLDGERPNRVFMEQLVEQRGRQIVAFDERLGDVLMRGLVEMRQVGRHQQAVAASNAFCLSTFSLSTRRKAFRDMM